MSRQILNRSNIFKSTITLYVAGCASANEIKKIDLISESCGQTHWINLDLFICFQLDVNETEGRKYRIRPVFKEDPSFKRLTDHNHTAVHIPTDIYDGCEYRDTQKPEW